MLCLAKVVRALHAVVMRLTEAPSESLLTGSLTLNNISQWLFRAPLLVLRQGSNRYEILLIGIDIDVSGTFLPKYSLLGLYRGL